MSTLSPSKKTGRAAKLAASIIGIVLLVGVVHVYNRHIAADALRAASLAQSERRADSLSRVVRADRHVLDSVRTAMRPDSVHLARLMPRIHIRTPTVVRIDTAVAPHSAPVPPVVVHVPAVMTDLMQTQARRIAQLETAVRVADQGWQHERMLRAEREHEIALLEQRRPRFGLKTGIVLGAVGAVLLIHAVAR